MAADHCPPACSLRLPARRTGGRGGGGYGGTLAPKPAESAPPAPTGGGRGFGGNPAVAYQRIRQLGVTHLLGVGVGGFAVDGRKCTPRRADREGRRTGGLQLDDQHPGTIIYGRETRDKDIEPFIASLEAAGKGGLTVVEYNFYAHRAIEGYYETVGRAKAGYTGFDYELELLVNENGAVVQPIYRDENGQITSETLAAVPECEEGEVPRPAASGQ